jgi:4-carboxymuconolactone decarboxylase
MDEKRYRVGLERRKEVLGEEYVNRSMQGANDFNREFQELVTEFAWGQCWGSDVLSKRERSILNLGMLAACGRMHEFELHFRGAITNGLSPEELKDVLTQIAVYCGIPAGVECFRVARRVLDEKA